MKKKIPNQIIYIKNGSKTEREGGQKGGRGREEAACPYPVRKKWRNEPMKWIVSVLYLAHKLENSS